MRKHLIILIAALLLPAFQARAQLDAILQLLGDAVMKKAESTTVAPNASWWEKILADAAIHADEIDTALEQLDELQKSSELSDKIYHGTMMLQNSPLLTQAYELCDSYYKNYDMLVDDYKRIFTSRLDGYQDAKYRMRQLSSMTDKVYRDMDFVTSFLFNPVNWKGTEMERYQLLEGFVERMKRHLDSLQAERNRLSAQVAVREQLKATYELNESDPARISDPFLKTLSEKSVEDFQQEVDASMAGLSDKSVKVSIQKGASSPAVRFGLVAIIILTLVYIPFNLWKVNSHERQASDAMMRIIIGLVFGISSLAFLSAMI